MNSQSRSEKANSSRFFNWLYFTIAQMKNGISSSHHFLLEASFKFLYLFFFFFFRKLFFLKSKKLVKFYSFKPIKQFLEFNFDKFSSRQLIKIYFVIISNNFKIIFRVIQMFNLIIKFRKVLT